MHLTGIGSGTGSGVSVLNSIVTGNGDQTGLGSLYIKGVGGATGNGVEISGSSYMADAGNIVRNSAFLQQRRVF